MVERIHITLSNELTKQLNAYVIGKFGFKPRKHQVVTVHALE